MTEAEKPKPTLLQRGWGLLQWAISIFALLLAALIVAVNQGLGVPGAPVTGLLVSFGIFALLAISLSPPVFFRLPKRFKIGIYIGFFIAFITFANFNGMVLDAYHRTPEGAKVAAARAAEEKAQALAEQRQAEAQVVIDGAKAAVAQLKEVSDKLEACRNWSGEVPAFSKAVREAAHDPDSFKHEKTAFIVATAEGSNAVMTYRAANGFGAIRRGQILARIDPDSCEVLSFSEPEQQ